MTINIEAKIPPITLRFVADLSEYESQKPYEIWLENVPAGIEKTNVQWVEHHNIPLQNMRLYPTSLDTTGFTYINHLSENLPEFISYRKESGEEFSVFQEGKSMELYLEETSKMVKELLSANVTFVQDWRHRKDTVEAAKSLEYLKNAGPDRMKVLKPALNVHLDDSKEGSLRRLSRVLSPEELERYDLSSYRIRFLNVWRPLIHVVENAPLALCDMRSVRQSDLLAVDKVHETHVNEANYIKYTPELQWYHLPDQTKEEPFIFVTWDSASAWPSPGAPHAAFDNPLARGDAPMRESIEVRLVAITKL